MKTDVKDAEILRLQDTIVKQNNLNKRLKEQLNMGDGRYKIEQAKAGMSVRTRKELDKDRYKKLHEAGYIQPEIAQALGMSVSTLRRRLREQREAIFARDQGEDVEKIISEIWR